MVAKMSQVLRPQYVQAFSCIGPACEETCCYDWFIPIDKVTYELYRKCPDQQLRLQMRKNVSRIRNNSTDNFYAKIRLQSDHYCPFFDQDRLCSIQRKLGEKYLSNTCDSYPRIINTINGVREVSLSLSCPEVARMVLLDPKPMEFDLLEEEVSTLKPHGNVWDTTKPESKNWENQYFWELRRFAITLLQNRSYSLWKRIAILGMFCLQVSNLKNTGNSGDVSTVIETFQQRINRGSYDEYLDEVPNNLEILIELIRNLVNPAQLQEFKHEGFRRCFPEYWPDAENAAGNLQQETVIPKYIDAYKKYYGALMQDKDYILENYVVHYMFRTHFPLNTDKNIFEQFNMLVLNYAMLKVLLIGMSGCYRDDCTVEHVIKTIQSFSRVIEHNDTYLQGAFQFLTNNQLNTLPYMIAFIRD